MQSSQGRTSEDIRGVTRGDIGMKAYLHGPLDAAKNLKLRFRVGDLDLPERRNIYTSVRVGEEEDKQNCPCGKAIESRTHKVAECELYQEERDVPEGEVRDLNKSGMRSFHGIRQSGENDCYTRR